MTEEAQGFVGLKTTINWLAVHQSVSWVRSAALEQECLQLGEYLLDRMIQVRTVGRQIFDRCPLCCNKVPDLRCLVR
jgi:hypothetical protein